MSNNTEELKNKALSLSNKTLISKVDTLSLFLMDKHYNSAKAQIKEIHAVLKELEDVIKEIK